MLKTKLKLTKIARKLLAQITTIKHKLKQNPQTQNNQHPRATQEPK